MYNVTIFTDGSCKPNPGSGGWAAILLHGIRRKNLSGGEPNTTNIRMELMAAVKAIEALRRPCRITLYTDSSIVVNCIQNTCRFKQNLDLIKQLQGACKKHSIQAIWIKGHSKLSENEECDQMASKAAERIKKNAGKDSISNTDSNRENSAVAI